MQQEQAIAFDGCASPWMTAEPHSTAKIRGLPCARHRGSWMLHWGRGEVLNSPMCVPERQMCSKSCHCLSCDRTPLPCHAKTDVFKVLPLLVMRSHTTALSCMVHHHCLVMQLHTTACHAIAHHCLVMHGSPPLATSMQAWPAAAEYDDGYVNQGHVCYVNQGHVRPWP